MNETLAQILIARYMYANGVTHISDADYDNYCRSLVDSGITLDPIYENDPVPYEAFAQVMGYSKEETDAYLANHNIIAASPVVSSSLFADDTQDLDFLTESASLSINAVHKFEEAFSWFTKHQDEEIVISTKIDGINTRRGYMNCGDHLEYRAALTRGRSSDPINITENMRIISPKTVTGCNESLVIYSETVVKSAFIDEANQKYDSTYTIPRGLAMAMMRVADKFAVEDYENLKSFVFRVDWGKTLVDGLELARKLGFDVVPYITYTYKGESFVEFKQQMEQIILQLKTATDSMDIITDGMVAEVNDRVTFSSGEISNNYSSANIALKIGLWEPGVYSSKVVELDLNPQFDRCACVAIVEPVVATGGQTISRVNCYNPSILFERNILPGSTIRFEYKNETTVNIILD